MDWKSNLLRGCCTMKLQTNRCLRMLGVKALKSQPGDVIRGHFLETHHSEWIIDLLWLWKQSSQLCTSKTTTSAVSAVAVLPLFTVCRAAPGFVFRWHHHNRLLCSLGTSWFEYANYNSAIIFSNIKVVAALRVKSKPPPLKQLSRATWHYNYECSICRLCRKHPAVPAWGCSFPPNIW